MAGIAGVRLLGLLGCILSVNCGQSYMVKTHGGNKTLVSTVTEAGTSSLKPGQDYGHGLKRKMKMSGDSNKRPNILYIVMDDVGIADIGCFGNKTIPTPHIDSLCKDGMKMTHHLAAYPVCTPSRVSALTGRYASREGMAEAQGTPPVVIYAAGRMGLPANATTWSKLLLQEGYSTAAFGKWHMGWNRESWGDQKHGPLGHGFEYFYGLPFTLVHGFDAASRETFFSVSRFTQGLWDGIPNLLKADSSQVSFQGKIFSHLFSGGGDLKTWLLALLGLKAFRTVGSKETLVVLLASWFSIQHMRMHTPKWWGRSKYMDRRLNSVIMEMPGNNIIMQPIDQTRSSSLINQKVLNYIKDSSSKASPWLAYYALTEAHTPLIVEKQFKGKSSHGAYGDTILQIDFLVGRVLDTLKETGADKNTLVYFTSDHGGHIDVGDSGGWNAPFRGGKFQAAQEGGVRVPGIVRWPGQVRPGSVLDQPSSQMDMMPTLVEVGKGKLPKNLLLDGVSMAGQLQGKSKEKLHEFMYTHCGTDIHSMRWHLKGGRVYKLIVKEPIYTNGPREDGSKAHCGGLCKCFNSPGEEDKVETHKTPKLYLLNVDPGEERPLDYKGRAYRWLVPRMLKALKKQKTQEARTNMHAQLQDSWRVLPAPWLQPCCDFPLCSCDRTKNPQPRSLLDGIMDSLGGGQEAGADYSEDTIESEDGCLDESKGVCWDDIDD